MDKRVKFAAALVAFLLVAGSAYFWFGRNNADYSSAGPARTARSLPEAAAVSSHASGKTLDLPEAKTGNALPPKEAPFRMVVDELRKRSGAGEAAATCRLAAEYRYCGQMAAQTVSMDDWLAHQNTVLRIVSAESGGLELGKSVEQQMQSRQENLKNLTSHCEGVELPSAADVAKLWRSAALAGSPSAMKQYSSGNAFRGLQTLEVLSELATYRNEAERIATVSASRGDFDTLLALAAGYQPTMFGSRPLIAQALKPDLARSLALYRHIETSLQTDEMAKARLGQDVRSRIERMEQQLPPSELSRADSIARSEIAQWRAPTLGDARFLSATGQQRDIDRGACAH